MQVGDHRRVAARETPCRERRSRLVGTLREHRVRTEVTELARDPNGKRGVERRPVERR